MAGFSVQTRAVVDGVAPLMLSTSPGFSVRIDVSAYAGVDNVYFEADEIDVLGVNVNPIQDINFGSPHLGPFNVGIPIPLSKTFTYKPNALLTLAGFSNADVDSGKLVVLFGAIDPSTPYLYVYGVS